LIVDDERGIRDTLRAVMEDEGFVADAVATGEECLKALGRRAYGCILLDVWLPGIDGLETLKQLREAGSDAAVVIISGHGNIETAVRATKLGAFDFIEKPLSIEKTVLTVRNALRQQKLELINADMAAALAKEYTMVGGSVAMRALRKQISVVAPTDGRVLIYGESGTGKELVAHAIHAESRRAAAPFIEVNSAAIPEELIESELFGHVKGAFTGATAAKKGKFELADGATIFLDEVGDMSPKVQAKVLRVLEEQRFEPVDQRDVVDLDLVELFPLEDPVVVAGCRVAVQHDPGVLDRRLVGVDHRQEVLLTGQGLQRCRGVGVVCAVEAGENEFGVMQAGLDPEARRAPVARGCPYL
jgi:two-component system nitrogen regulation response regulator NtrX